MSKKITIAIINPALEVLSFYKDRGMANSSLINTAIIEYKENHNLGLKQSVSGTIKGPLEESTEIKKAQKFIEAVPIPPFQMPSASNITTTKKKHFMTTADKIWLEAYRMAESKGGTMSDEGWIEFEKIVPHQWYLDMKAAGEI